MYIDPNEESGQQKTIDKLKDMGYVPGLGFGAKGKSQANSANNTTRENANDRQNTAALDNAQAGVAGAGALITQAQAGSSSNNQNSSNMGGSAYSDQARIDAKLRADEAGQMRAAVQVSFGDIGDDDRARIASLNRAANALERVGVSVTPAIKEAFKSMDLEDLNAVASKLAQSIRLEEMLNIVPEAVYLQLDPNSAERTRVNL